MLLLATDEDINGAIVRGLRRKAPDIDLVRVRDALPEGTPDPQVLDWAARENRVLITNDRSTMVGFAYQRIRQRESIVAVIATTKTQPIGAAIDDILLIAEHMEMDEILEQVVVFLPFT